MVVFCNLFYQIILILENIRKRINLGGVFNINHHAKHERLQHSEKRVKVKHLGAPKNPFETSKVLFKDCSPIVSTYVLK